MHPNAQLAMRGFQAFAEGDMATMKEIISDDVVWHSGGRSKWAGDYHGLDATLRLFAEITAEAQIDNEPHAVLADDDHVVVLVNATVTRGDDTLTGDQVFVMHVDDGKLTEAWVTSSDQYAWDEFWAD